MHLKTKAFTLIELLVVIAIIALLISLLLPALGIARRTAQKIVGSASQRGLVQNQTLYINDSKDYFAGPNTSGAEHLIFGPGQSIGQNLLGDKTAATPTTTHDWISPILGEAGGLPANRARRTQKIFNKLGCPTARLQNDQLYGSAPDVADFRQALDDGGFKQVSFLSPSAFHYLPMGEVAARFLGNGRFQRYMVDGFGTPVKTPSSYRPKLERVGRPSGKVFVMDGNRYLATDPSGTVLDFDIGVAPGIYGSFLDAGPIFDNSTAYGRSVNSPSQGEGWKLSVRHVSKTMNVCFFDGHGASLKGDEIWGDASYWYPSGSTFTGGGATPEATAKYTIGQIID
ncbi:MAG: prepilin-type N-terminal cleavage/methylation domain-containing protein [Planctomycetota bacterium]